MVIVTLTESSISLSAWKNNQLIHSFQSWRIVPLAKDCISSSEHPELRYCKVPLYMDNLLCDIVKLKISYTNS